MSEEIGAWKKFWHKIFSFLSGNFSEKAVRRIMAAFGSFLMIALGYITVVITHYVNIWITTAVLVDAVIGIWVAFAGFVGVFIVSFFGTTETLPDEDKALLAKAKELVEYAKAHPDDVLTDAISGLLIAAIEKPEEIPDVPEPEPKPEPIIE
jgi:hypothetical protein